LHLPLEHFESNRHGKHIHILEDLCRHNVFVPSGHKGKKGCYHQSWCRKR